MIDTQLGGNLFFLCCLFLNWTAFLVLMIVLHIVCLLCRFLGSDNKATFFTNTDRTRVVNEILQSSTYGKRRRAEIGIDRLLEEDIFQAAYPLHDVMSLFYLHFLFHFTFNISSTWI